MTSVFGRANRIEASEMQTSHPALSISRAMPIEAFPAYDEQRMAVQCADW
jgi:hypothetical protein